MSEIKNGRLGLYGTEHSKCITLGFKELIFPDVRKTLHVTKY